MTELYKVDDDNDDDDDVDDDIKLTNTKTLLSPEAPTNLRYRLRKVPSELFVNSSTSYTLRYCTFRSRSKVEVHNSSLRQKYILWLDYITGTQFVIKICVFACVQTYGLSEKRCSGMVGKHSKEGSDDFRYTSFIPRSVEVLNRLRDIQLRSTISSDVLPYR
jgi:hypothetical protein